MEPFFEPMPGKNGVTTAQLVEKWGAIVARGNSHNAYQFIKLANGLVYESTLWNSSDGSSIWLPWSRRPCHDVSRLARSVQATLELV